VLQEELLQTDALLAALSQLTVEGFAELLVAGAAGQFGERGDKLGFGTEEIAKLVVVELFKVCSHGV
jgi:hypothetical protein